MSTSRNLVVMLFLTMIFGGAMPLVVSPHTLWATDTLAGTKYDVFIASNVSIRLYLLDKNLSVFEAPLSKALPSSCTNMSVPLLSRSNYQEISVLPGISGIVRVSPFYLPNGSLVYSVLFVIYDYLGCTKNRARLLRVITEYRGEGMLNAYIAVAVPIKDPDEYGVESILYPKNIVISYRYFNTTHFEVDIIIYSASYNIYGGGIPSRTYNARYRFLVSLMDWRSWYWDCNKWVPAGVFPLASPLIAPALLIYRLYHNYYDDTEYYMDHHSDLEKIVEKIARLKETSGWIKADEYLANFSEQPALRALRVFNTTYLGRSIEIDYLRHNVLGPIIEARIPPINGIQVETMQSLSGKAKEQLAEGLVEYIKRGDKAVLENVIEEYNGFVTGFKTYYMGGGRAGLAWAFVSDPEAPGIKGITMLALPGIVMRAGLGLGDKPRYSVISLACPNNPARIKALYNVPSEQYLHWIRRSAGTHVVLAIDTRLARAMLFSPTKAGRAINALMSRITTMYARTWYRIACGDNPAELLREFVSELNKTIVSTGLWLGGRDGAAILEDIINHNGRIELEAPSTHTSHGGTAVTPWITRTTITPSRKTGENCTVISRPASASTRHNNYYMIGAAALVVICSAAYWFWRRIKR